MMNSNGQRTFERTLCVCAVYVSRWLTRTTCEIDSNRSPSDRCERSVRIKESSVNRIGFWIIGSARILQECDATQFKSVNTKIEEDKKTLWWSVKFFFFILFIVIIRQSTSLYGYYRSFSILYINIRIQSTQNALFFHMPFCSRFFFLSIKQTHTQRLCRCSIASIIV